jgi:2-polyprenyl-3-methyl-5-hydroxy-6-metoxy-1,4-benzoquinol methylase
MFSYSHLKEAKASTKDAQVKLQISNHINAIYKLANSRAKEFGIVKKTLNWRYESHLKCLNVVGEEYLAAQSTSEAVLALQNCGNSLLDRQAKLEAGDFSFTHDDSAEATFNELQKFCFLSTWDLSNVIRYLHTANTVMEHADSNSKKQINVVDIGCSSGTFLGFWYNNCQRAGKTKLNYLGLEVAEQRYLEAHERWGSHDNLKFKNVDVISNPLHQHTAENSVDALLVMEVIEHIGQDNARDLLEDSFKCLAPGGILCISSPNPKKDRGQQFVWIDNHVYEFSLAEMRNELQSAGFEIVNETGWLCDLPHLKPTFNEEQLKLFNSLKGLGTGIAGSILSYLMPEEAKHYTIIARKPV